MFKLFFLVGIMLVGCSHPVHVAEAPNPPSITPTPDQIACNIVTGDGVTYPVGPQVDPNPGFKIFGWNFSSLSSLYSISVTDANPTVGIFPLAISDVDGDGTPDIITAYRTDPNSPVTVHVYNGKDPSQVCTFVPYPENPSLDTRLAAADLLGTGNAQVITSSASYPIRIFSIISWSGNCQKQLYQFTSVDTSSYAGGIPIAAGKAQGSSPAYIITSTSGGLFPNGNPLEVKRFDFTTKGGFLSVQTDPNVHFYPFGTDYQGAIFIAGARIDASGAPNFVAGRASALGSACTDCIGPNVRVYSGAQTPTLLSSFHAFDPSNDQIGARVAASTSADGTKAYIATAPGAGLDSPVTLWDATTNSVVQQISPAPPGWLGGVALGMYCK